MMKKRFPLFLTCLLLICAFFAAGAAAEDAPHEHAWEFVSHVDFTCSEDGYDLYVCPVCGEEEKRITDTASHMNELVFEKAATCEEGGEEVYVCTVCGEETKITTPPLGHEWSEGETVKKPALFTAGSVKCVCKRDPSHVKYDPVPSEFSQDGAVRTQVLLILASAAISALFTAGKAIFSKKKRQ